MFRRLALIGFLCLAACDLLKKEEDPPPPVQLAFIPSQCSFNQTLTGDARFTAMGINEPVQEYICDMYSKMDCRAYALADESMLGLECTVIDLAQRNGVPSGCTSAASGDHGFLDGIVVNSAEHYDCGVLNSNLLCDYYYYPGYACNDTNGSALDDCPDGEDQFMHEEIRCHLM